ncbi:MAG: hypothetical protein GXP55_02205 [Deltaproteobacteria bacterium]|nr:hypothetical protein [Deltaproteobacteria bacterium]
MRTRGRRITMLILGALVCSLLLVGYTTETVTNGGTIRGSVHLTGAPPAEPPFHVTDQSQVPVCGTDVANDEVVTGPGGALANAVVWIDGIQRGAAPQRETITLGQRGCRFVPRIQATTRGSRVTVASEDATLHNVHGKLGRRTVFNLALPSRGVRITRTLNQPGVIEFNCDAGHTWMRAFIHVFDHPYFAMTGVDGTFEIPNVPPGQHTVKIWHEHYGTQTRRLTVAAGGTVTWDATVH